MDLTRQSEIPSSSVIDLAEIWPAVVQDYIVNLIKDLRAGHCFVSSRTRRIKGGKTTTFKLSHSVFEDCIR
jgi:hypothetical protein